MHSERALSESLTTVLILSFVVILALAVFCVAGGYSVIPQKSANILPELQNQTLNDKNFLTIIHRGGDPLTLRANSPGRNHLGIYLDAMTGSYRALPVAGLSQFSAGDTLYIYYDSAKRGYNVTNDRSALSSATIGSVSLCPMTVRLVDEDTKVLLKKWTWTCGEITGFGPTVTSMNSATGNRGWPTVRNITGTNFLPGATALLNRSDGAPEIPGTSCIVYSQALMGCTFDLKDKAISLPRYNVVVINPDGKRAVRMNYFTLRSLAPSLTSSTPSSGLQGATVTITRLRGSNFQPGATVEYRNGTTSIPLSGATVINSTSISGTLTIPDDATIGYYNITVTNNDNGNATRTNLFRVTSNAPTVTSITNKTGYAGWPVIENITGTNFALGSTAHFVNGTSTIMPDSCTYVSTTRLFCVYSLTGAEDGAKDGYSIIVSNPNGKTGLRANNFTASNPTPVVSGSTPSTGVQGTTVTITTLSGTYFQPGATVTYWNSSTGTSYSLASVDVPSRTRITGTLTLPSDAPRGYYNIIVTNPDGKSGKRTNAFVVYPYAAPTLSGISPTHGQRGVNVPVLVTGTNFRAGARVRLYNGSTALYLAPVGTATSTQITTSFTVPVGVIPNVSNVRVTNPDGQYAILTRAYTIDP